MPLTLIACDGCGRYLATENPDALLAVITGPCHRCGGQFTSDSDESISDADASTPAVERA